MYTGESDEDVGPQPVSNEWWAEYVKPEDEEKIELGGKLVLLFEILRMSEEIGDKVWDSMCFEQQKFMYLIWTFIHTFENLWYSNVNFNVKEIFLLSSHVFAVWIMQQNISFM